MCQRGKKVSLWALRSGSLLQTGNTGEAYGKSPERKHLLGLWRHRAQLCHRDCAGAREAARPSPCGRKPGMWDQHVRLLKGHLSQDNAF